MEFHFDQSKLQIIAEKMQISDVRDRENLKHRLEKIYKEIVILELWENCAGSREIQIEKYNRLKSALKEAVECANDSNLLFKRTLNTILPSTIAKIVTNQTVQELIPGTQSILTPLPPERRHPSRDAYDADNDMLEKKRNIVAENTGYVLSQLLDAIRVPVEEALRLEKVSDKSKGGNPGNSTRIYLIKAFLPVYEYFTQSAATYSLTGKFVTIIDTICREFEIETTGLPDAVRYQIERTNKTQNSTRKKVRKRPDSS
jgi:hypothetical protein